MRADRSSSVPVSAQGRLTLEFALLPDKLVVGVQDKEVVDIGRRDEVLLAPGSRVYAPPSEKNNIGAADVGGMTVSGERRGA